MRGKKEERYRAPCWTERLWWSALQGGRGDETARTKQTDFFERRLRGGRKGVWGRGVELWNFVNDR